MKNVFVDSGVFFAWIDHDDENHNRAKAFFRKAIAMGTKLITTNFILAETHALILARMRRRDLALEFLESLIGGWASVERVTREDEAGAVVLLKKYDDKNFSFCDAISFKVMERKKIRMAAAFDRHFRQYSRLDLVV